MPTSPVALAPPIQERSFYNDGRGIAFGLLAAVQVTLILAITVIAIALPVIQRDLGLLPGQLALVSAGYGLAFSGLLLLGGRLADGLGPRRPLFAGLVIFGVASVAAGLAPGFGTLLAARFGQGVGAALAAPAAMALLRVLYPDPADHARALGQWGGLAPLGATAGILISGVAVTMASWRWAFAIPAAVAVVVLVAGRRLVPMAAPVKMAGFDIPGAVLVAAGIGSLSYGLGTAGDHGWSATGPVVTLAIGITALTGFAAVESKSRVPLVPPAFLRSPGRLLALTAVMAAAAGHASAAFFLALYFQQIRGFSALATTGAFVPLVLVLPLAGFAASRLLREVRPSVVAAAGLALSAAGLASLGRITVESPYVGTTLAGLVLLPAGVAMTFSAATVLAVRGAGPNDAGLAAGLLNTAIELGPAVGLAALVAVSSTRSAQLLGQGHLTEAATVNGYRWALSAAAIVLTVIAAGLAALGHRIEPARQERTAAGPDRRNAPDLGHPRIPTQRSKPMTTMTTPFVDHVALVTGGGAGIGRATAVALARAGATVVVAGRRLEPLAETVSAIELEGGKADAIATDVTEAGEVENLIKVAVERHGRLDIAVNNAGVLGTPGPLADIDEATWSDVLATNLTGVWLSMKHEIAHMGDHGGGVIVNIASTIGAHMTLPNMGAYAASKAAVSTLTRTAAKEYIGAGIRINAVSPGPVDTPMSRFDGESDADRDDRIATVLPIGRVATTGEIAATVLWLASPAASFVVGHDLVIDGAGTP